MDSRGDLVDDSRGDARHFASASSSPVQAFHLVGENNAVKVRAVIHRHLKRVTFHPAGDGAAEHQAGSAVVCRPETTSLDQIRGKTIAIPGHATMQDCLIQKGARKAGLTPEMLRLMVLKPPEMLQAMTAGNIDCFIAWEPYPAQALSMGEGTIVARSNALWKEHPCCVLITNSRFAQSRPEDTEKIIRAHRKACRFISDHPEQALTIAVRYTGMPRSVIKQAMSHMRYSPDIDRAKAGDFAGFLSDLHYLSPSSKTKKLTFFNEK